MLFKLKNSNIQCIYKLQGSMTNYEYLILNLNSLKHYNESNYLVSNFIYSRLKNCNLII